MSERRKGAAGKGELVLVLLTAALTEALFIRYFQPELRGEVMFLLSLVSAGSLLVIGTSWMHLSSRPLRLEARTVRQSSPRRRRKTRLSMLSGFLSDRLRFRGDRRTATVIVLLLLFVSFSSIVLLASKTALSAYRMIYASTPEYVQPYLRGAYNIVKPLMRLNPTEKCLLVQNVPAVFVAACSLIISRRAE